MCRPWELIENRVAAHFIFHWTDDQECGRRLALHSSPLSFRWFGSARNTTDSNAELTRACSLSIGPAAPDGSLTSKNPPELNVETCVRSPSARTRTCNGKKTPAAGSNACASKTNKGQSTRRILDCSDFFPE